MTGKFTVEDLADPAQPYSITLVELEAWKSKARCASGYLAAGSSLDLRFP